LYNPQFTGKNSLLHSGANFQIAGSLKGRRYIHVLTIYHAENIDMKRTSSPNCLTVNNIVSN